MPTFYFWATLADLLCDMRHKLPGSFGLCGFYVNLSRF
ncbi:hypothetical protein CAMRE0001_1124 [Campylobacter rectus RM3267]|uniref:Uncharacterized protein n=1 Tax=Campylobacter rectus RM3267 TaxID=553218 RepID=B9D0C4_CAMRE|nr:hypothetical protein CAMRE0001_1124 [Campylobacter rectus RM3267]